MPDWPVSKRLSPNRKFAKLVKPRRFRQRRPFTSKQQILVPSQPLKSSWKVSSRNKFIQLKLISTEPKAKAEGRQPNHSDNNPLVNPQASPRFDCRSNIPRPSPRIHLSRLSGLPILRPGMEQAVNEVLCKYYLEAFLNPKNIVPKSMFGLRSKEGNEGNGWKSLILIKMMELCGMIV